MVCGALLGIAVRLLDNIIDTSRFPLLQQAGNAHGTRRMMGQNVYLFCQSECLATIFCGAADFDSLNRTIQLGTDQFVTFAQTAGDPRQ